MKCRYCGSRAPYTRCLGPSICQYGLGTVNPAYTPGPTPLDLLAYAFTALVIVLVGMADFGLFPATNPWYLFVAGVGCAVVSANCYQKRAWSGVVINGAFGLISAGALLKQWWGG